MFKTFLRNKLHITWVQRALFIFTDNLRERAIVHDNSKFVEDEARGYARFEDMPEGLEYGSPEHKAAMAKIMENNDCFVIHSARNDHHPEHYDKVSEMGLFALVECVCDWAGATIAYGNKGNWQDSVEHNIKRYGFTPPQVFVIRETAQYLEKQIPDLKE